VLVLTEAKKYYKIKVQNYIDKMKNKKYHTKIPHCRNTLKYHTVGTH